MKKNKRRRHYDIGLTLRIKREKALEEQRRRRPKLILAVFLMLFYCMSGCMTIAIAEEQDPQTIEASADSGEQTKEVSTPAPAPAPAPAQASAPAPAPAPKKI